MHAQNRTKLIAAITLLGLGVFPFLRMYRNQKSAPTAAAEPRAEVPAGSVDSPGTGHGQASRPLGHSKDPAVFLSAPMQDPTLRLEVLMKSTGTKYGSRRNIFQAVEDVSEPTRSPIQTLSQMLILTCRNIRPSTSSPLELPRFRVSPGKSSFPKAKTSLLPRRVTSSIAATEWCASGPAR